MMVTSPELALIQVMISSSHLINVGAQLNADVQKTCKTLSGTCHQCLTRQLQSISDVWVGVGAPQRHPFSRFIWLNTVMQSLQAGFWTWRWGVNICSVEKTERLSKCDTCCQSPITEEKVTRCVTGPFFRLAREAWTLASELATLQLSSMPNIWSHGGVLEPMERTAYTSRNGTSVSNNVYR